MSRSAEIHRAVPMMLLVFVGVACGGARSPQLPPPVLEPVTASDRDHDGIVDQLDKCPDDAEDLDGFEDGDGCPDPDNDRDGILDKHDNCPNEPEDKDGYEDTDGCPDPDNDHDGILDRDDKCPNEPETFNGFEDEDGCPDVGLAFVGGHYILLTRALEFDYNSAKISQASNELVLAIAFTLIAHPEILLIEVQVFETGPTPNPYLLKLSIDRAASVVRAIIAHGVAAARVRPQGFGAYCPLPGTPSTRVELAILKTDVGKTSVPTGCANATANGVKSLRVPP